MLAACTARLEVDGETVDLVDPEAIDSEEAFALLPAGTKHPPRLLRIHEFLRMGRAPAAG